MMGNTLCIAKLNVQEIMYWIWIHFNVLFRLKMKKESLTVKAGKEPITQFYFRWRTKQWFQSVELINFLSQTILENQFGLPITDPITNLSKCLVLLSKSTNGAKTDLWSTKTRLETVMISIFTMKTTTEPTLQISFWTRGMMETASFLLIYKESLGNAQLMKRAVSFWFCPSAKKLQLDFQKEFTVTKLAQEAFLPKWSVKWSKLVTQITPRLTTKFCLKLRMFQLTEKHLCRLISYLKPK